MTTRPLLTHTSTGDSWTLTDFSGEMRCVWHWPCFGTENLDVSQRISDLLRIFWVIAVEHDNQHNEYSFSCSRSVNLYLTPRWQSRTCTPLFLWELQNHNSLLNNHWQENVGFHQKKIPHIQEQRRNLSKTIGGVKMHLESNPLPTRDAQRAKTNLVCTRTQRLHRDWARTVWVSPEEVWGSSGLL